MKTGTTLFVIIATLASVSLTDGCSYNCQKCMTQESTQTNVCAICYRSLLVLDSCKPGGPDHCDVALDENYCFRCSVGYLANLGTGQCFSTTGKIDNCASGNIDTDGVATCDACIRSAPSSDGKKCNQAQKFHNCVWESLTQCQRCDDGYIYDPIKMNCAISTIKGCLFLDGTTCTGCNVYSSYFMTTPGHCVKGTSIEQALERIFSIY